MNENKKILLVTGWTWYIWSHWVVAFEKAWYKTVIVDNFVNSNIECLNWIEKILGYKPDFFEVDLRDKDKLKKVFQKYNFDWVLHFAWLKAVWESSLKPLEYFDNNINWSLKLFELMNEFGVKNIIFSSSATVYKPSHLAPLPKVEGNITQSYWLVETDLVWDCTNPYWTTKYLLEQILIDLSKFSWFRVMNLRYFNPIWAHESWYIWENPNWLPNNLLPFVMKVAVWELKEVNVFWDDYDTKDWTWIRDYIDVVDLIDWHLKAYEKLINPSLTLPLNLMEGNNKWFFETYNLWTWSWISVLEIIKNVQKITWKEIKYKITDRRSWDLAEVYCNPLKANTKLNWKAKISIEESIKNMWKFYSNLK